MRIRYLKIADLGLLLLNPGSSVAQGMAGQAAKIQGGNGAIAWSGMEVFDGANWGARIMIFHPRDKADGPQWGSLCWAHSGKAMELEFPRGRS